MRSRHRVPGRNQPRNRTAVLCILRKTGGYRKSMSDQTPEEQRLLGPTYRGLFLFSLFLVCAFNFADRAIFAVLAQSIRVDLKLTDFDLGLLQVSFGLLYAGMGIPFGRLAE